MLVLLALVTSPFQPPELPAFVPPRTLGQVLERGLVVPDDTLPPAELARLLWLHCLGGDPVACLVYAGPARNAPALEALCSEGEPDACLVVAWLAGQAHPLDEAVLARTCRLGGHPACVVGLRARARLAGPAPAARAAAEAACRAGVAAGCVLRAELEPDPAIRTAQLAALCTDDDARGCVRLWTLAGRLGDRGLAAHAALRGCGLGVARLCGAAVAAWLGGKERRLSGRRAARLRARACALEVDSVCDGARVVREGRSKGQSDQPVTGR